MIAVIRQNPAETSFSPFPSESLAESRRTASDEEDAIIERTIVWAFGHALIQSEVTLFYKVRMMLPRTRISEESFRMYLEKLKAKRYLAECHFQRAKCWRRLVVDEDSIDETPSW